MLMKSNLPKTMVFGKSNSTSSLWTLRACTYKYLYIYIHMRCIHQFNYIKHNLQDTTTHSIYVHNIDQYIMNHIHVTWKYIRNIIHLGIEELNGSTKQNKWMSTGMSCWKIGTIMVWNTWKYGKYTNLEVGLQPSDLPTNTKVLWYISGWIHSISKN